MSRKKKFPALAQQTIDWNSILIGLQIFQLLRNSVSSGFGRILDILIAIFSF